MAQIALREEFSNGKQAAVAVLSSRLEECTLCKDLVRTRSRVVSGYGDLNAQAMFIGEAPGRLGADITGIPFTKDRSGVFLQKMLCMIGMNLGDPKSELPILRGAYITNIVRCNPKSHNNVNRSPSKNEISNCSGYLEREINIIKPQIIVTLGLPASKIILGKEFQGKDFGKMRKTKDGSCVMPLWHPAFVIRGGGRKKLNEVKYAKFFQEIASFVSRGTNLNE